MESILYLPTRYFPSISGAEFYLQRMAEILSLNYKIDIFTSNALDFNALRDPNGKILDKSNKFFDKVNHLKINRFPIKYDNNIEEKLNALKKIKEFKLLNLSQECVSKFLENGPYLIDLIDYFFLNQDKLNYDFIHTTFFPYFNLIIGLIVGRLINKPTICTPFFHFSNPRYIDITLIEVLKKFDLLIACTNIEKKKLVDNFGISEEKVKVIPMGVDYNIFETKLIKKNTDFNFKEKFFMKGEKKYKMVLFCGYKNYEKGAISILKSIPFILKKYRKLYFIFIGPSTIAFNKELSKIQKITNARIVNLTPSNLTGYFDKKKIAAFKQSDIYLMPSRSDAFGIAFLEAWASGIPVIGANIGATPEVIRENVDGLLVEFDNSIDIANKVLKLLKNQKLRKNLGSAGQEKVSQNFTWEIVAEKTHNIYQSLKLK